MKAKPTGRSLELFFIDGKPDGMQTAEVFNWTGHVLMTPRTRISDALRRKEAQYSGVYLLIGEGETGEPMLYVGESESIGNRIRTHDTKKDWWATAILITTAANVLHKAHVRYLEARLVEIATTVGKVTLDNNATPGGSSLPEAAQVNMEVFLDTLMMVLPALRIDYFLEQSRPSPTMPDSTAEAPIFELVNTKHKVKATAVFQDGELVVQEGSHARDQWHGRNSENSSYAHLFVELVRTGVLKVEGNHAVFTRNYAFKSPSAAGAIINGRPTNGTIEWKIVGTGRTYKEWEAETLDSERGERLLDEFR